MGSYHKFWNGGRWAREQARQLWENEESLRKYLAVLKEFWDEEKQEWMEERRPVAQDVSDIDVGDIKKPRQLLRGVSPTPMELSTSYFTEPASG